MAAKNTSDSKSKSDIKKIKINDSSTKAAVDALSISLILSNSTEQDSLSHKKGLELSDDHLIEVKGETDDLNKVDGILSNKSSMSSRNTSVAATAASALISKAIKKEILTSNEESVSKVSIYTSTPMKPVKGTNLQAAEENSSNTTGATQASDENNKECNKVIRLAAKNLTDEERKVLRAKRFNIIVAEAFQTERDRPKKVSNPAYRNSSSSGNEPTPTYNTLKKRAERFGENVSTVMKSLDHKEKLLKRKLKFLESVTNLKELEIKKRRTERFRMV